VTPKIANIDSKISSACIALLICEFYMTAKLVPSFSEM